MIHAPTTMIERRALWAETAKSGKYTQTRHILKHPDKDDCFCFVGLACELYIEMHVDAQWVYNDDAEAFDYYVAGSPGQSATRAIANFFGLNSFIGEYGPPDGKMNTLVEQNDEYELNFEQMAELLLSEPPGLLSPQGVDERAGK